MSVLYSVLLIILGSILTVAQRRLALPDPRSCANRKHILLLFPITIPYWLFLLCY